MAISIFFHFIVLYYETAANRKRIETKELNFFPQAERKEI